MKLERTLNDCLHAQPDRHTFSYFPSLHPQPDGHTFSYFPSLCCGIAGATATEEEAVEAAAKLASRHLTDRKLPDTAIDVLDEVGAAVHLKKGTSVDLAAVEEAVARARADSRPLGQELIRRGWISDDQLDEALDRQAQSDRRLGDILVEENLVSRETLDDVLDTVARRP